ncbi:class I SAM-dependent methyltransferase [Nocardioides montaniterrae]
MNLLHRVPGIGGWSEDPLWASFYDWTVEHPLAGGALWRAGIHSDLTRLYRAADEIGEQPAGARILDIPSGGGVALRGLRPDQGVEYVAADISPTMLERTMRAAARRGVVDQVTPTYADVGAMPFPDDDFDLVVSFTGIHCFPDPQAAVAEMCRVLKAGGVITGSTLLSDNGLVYEPMRRIGRLGGVLGPLCTRAELYAWLVAGGIEEPVIEESGAMAYFRGAKAELGG